jgi:hypothetical protein
MACQGKTKLEMWKYQYIPIVYTRNQNSMACVATYLLYINV